MSEKAHPEAINVASLPKEDKPMRPDWTRVLQMPKARWTLLALCDLTARARTRCQSGTSSLFAMARTALSGLRISKFKSNELTTPREYEN